MPPSGDDGARIGRSHAEIKVNRRPDSSTLNNFLSQNYDSPCPLFPRSSQLTSPCLWTTLRSFLPVPTVEAGDSLSSGSPL